MVDDDFYSLDEIIELILLPDSFDRQIYEMSCTFFKGEAEQTIVNNFSGYSRHAINEKIKKEFDFLKRQNLIPHTIIIKQPENWITETAFILQDNGLYGILFKWD